MSNPCPHPIAKLRNTPDGRRINWDAGFVYQPCGLARSQVGLRFQRDGQGGFTCGLHRTAADDTFDALHAAGLADGSIGTGPVRFKEQEIL